MLDHLATKNVSKEKEKQKKGNKQVELDSGYIFNKTSTLDRYKCHANV